MPFAQQSVAELVTAARQKGKEGDFAYAAAIYEKAIALDTNNLELRLDYASVLEDDEDFEAALAQIATVLAIDPKISRAYNLAGIIYQTRRQYGFALRAYSSAIPLADSARQKAALFSNRGAVYQNVQEWDSALADLDSALHYDPTSHPVANNRATVLLRIDRLPEAIATLKTIAGDTTAGQIREAAYSNIALTYTRMDSLDLAFLYFDTATTYLRPTEEPTGAGLHYSNLADALRRAGRHQEGITSIEKSIKYYPGNSYAYRTMGLLYLGLAKLTEACRSLSYARDLDFARAYGPEVAELLAEHCGDDNDGGGGGN